MSTSTITNTIKDPSGVAVSGVTVVARLKPGPAFRVSDNTEIAGQVSTTTNGSGVWTLALEQTANISPSGTWWEIEEQIPDAQGGRRTWAIQVGATNATLQASVVLQPPGGDVIGYLTQATADGRYVAKGFPYFNVRDYGAAIDAVTDDTAAVQAAVDAAITAGGGVVFVPPGTCLISGVAAPVPFNGSALVGIQLADNVTLAGAGRGVSTLKGPAMVAGATLTHFTMLINKNPTTGASNVHVCDLTISLDSPLQSGTGLTRYNMAGDFRGLAYSTFERLNVKNGGISLAPNSTYMNTASALSLGGNKGNAITHCLFQNMTGTTQFFQGTDCEFSWNRVENAWDDAFSVASAGTGHRICDNWIDNTPVVSGKGASSGAVYLNNDGAVLSTVEAMAEIVVARNKMQGSNTFNSGVRAGVAFAGAARDIKIVDNLVGPNLRDGIYVLDGNRQNVLIDGNTIYKNAGNGINCQANVNATTVEGVRIVDNDIHTNGSGGTGVGVGLSASGAGAVLKVEIADNRIYDDGTGNQGISVNLLTNVICRVHHNRLKNSTAINGSPAAGSFLQGNEGYNPVGHAVTQPSVPATTVAQTNNSGVDCAVFVNGGTVSAVAIGGTATGATGGWFRVPAGQTITLTYTVAPTWTWYGD